MNVRRDNATAAAHSSSDTGWSSRARAHTIAFSITSSVGSGGTGTGMYCACDPLRCGATTMSRATLSAISTP